MRIKSLFMPTVALVMSALTVSCGGNNAESEENIASDTANAQNVAATETPVAAEVPSWMPDSVTVLPSGLGIVIEEAGDDVRAGANTPVTLHYRGTLPDGQVFDSSYDRGEPATFSAAQVIPGFGEGIRQIGNGGKATLYIPYYLGYGANGAGPIAPYQNLIFDIEIIQIAQ